jgi:hypothetical protein
VGSKVIFLFDFDCGDRETVAGVVEKACWEGRLLDRERRALPDGRSGISFVAMMQLSPCCKKLTLSSEVKDHFGSRNCYPMTPQKVRRRSALEFPRVWAFPAIPAQTLDFQILVHRVRYPECL